MGENRPQVGVFYQVCAKGLDPNNTLKERGPIKRVQEGGANPETAGTPVENSPATAEKGHQFQNELNKAKPKEDTFRSGAAAVCVCVKWAQNLLGNK